jgi:hypothetical protein
MSRPAIRQKSLSPTKSYRQDVRAAPKDGPSFATASPGQNRLTIVAIFLIVLLAALNLMFLFPDFGSMIEQYNQF